MKYDTKEEEANPPRVRQRCKDRFLTFPITKSDRVHFAVEAVLRVTLESARSFSCSVLPRKFMTLIFTSFIYNIKLLLSSSSYN